MCQGGGYCARLIAFWVRESSFLVVPTWQAADVLIHLLFGLRAFLGFENSSHRLLRQQEEEGREKI